MFLRLTSVVLCLLAVQPLQAQTDSQYVSISFQFGPSNHRFNDLADFLSNISQNNITDDQRLLNVSGQVNYRFLTDYQASFLYQLDIGTMDLSNKQNLNYPQVTYLSLAFAAKFSWFLYNYPYYRMGISPVVGYVSYRLEQSEGVIDVLPKGESSGLIYGISLDNEVEVLDDTFFLLTAGLDTKTSGTVTSNSSSYSFKSFNMYLKFGVNFYL